MSERPGNGHEARVIQSSAFPQEELQDERTKRMKYLDDLQKDLGEMKKKLNEASVRCYKLNIDVATMFNPEMLETLETYKEECERCLSGMSKTLNEPLEFGAISLSEKGMLVDEN